jgi:plastocyanin
MHEFMFCVSGDCSNNTATIQAGGTITWTWNESASDPNPNCDTFQNPIVSCPGHTTTAADKKPSGQPLWSDFCKAPDGVPGCPYTFAFTQPGTYHYYCVYHGGRAYGNTPNNPITNMDGTVVVVAAASTASNAAPASSPTPSPVALAVTGGGRGAAPSLWAEVALGAGVTLIAMAVLAGRRLRRRL